MKNKLFLSNFRKIKSSYKRFFSLLFLSFLGVGFFCGIRGSSPDMLETIDAYYKEQNVFDIEVLSSLGFSEGEVEDLQQLDFSRVTGIKSIDSFLSLQGQEKVIQMTSLSDLNQLEVLEGNLPSSSHEIVLEEKMKEDFKLKVGDSITIKNDALKHSKFVISGFVKSPLYFSDYRGTTNLGNGELNYYTYVLEEAFLIPYYTSVSVKLDTAYQTNSREYLDVVEKGIETLKSAKTNSFATWYYRTREDNPAYASFLDATEGLEKIGTVFPILFFLVAVLISLISMTRMVLEDRGEIGTLKALGFSNRQLVWRYLFYAFWATSIGGILGASVGFALLPKIVWSIYTALFDVPNFVCVWSKLDFFLGLFVSLLCIVGSTYFSCIQVLREKPSELMRPLAPKIGKKIFLEKFSFWKHLSFSNKITYRNIFLYKRKVLVTMVGIIGSTALILVGFGVKDSVYNLVDSHFSKIFVYDAMIRLKDQANSSEVFSLLKKNKEIVDVVGVNYSFLDLYNLKNEKREVNLIVPDTSESLSQVIHLRDVNQRGEEISLEDNKVVLSEKLARLLEVKVGETVKFVIQNQDYEVEVSHIAENYFQDYVYMNRVTYEKLFSSYEINVLYFNQTDSYDKEFDKTIQKNQNVSNMIRKKTTSKLMEDVLESLNSVVVVLIFSSAILAFVILYNISTIHISERKRELSTLKVLGFYDEEVDRYITRENYIITVVGIFLGLIVGYFLSHYVISTCEPDSMMFGREIKLLSFVSTSAISFFFTLVVSRITHFNLKKIDMVESLKSME